MPVIPGVFHLTLVNNEGIAFGLFHQHEGLLLILISLSLILLFVWGHTLKHTRLSRWGIGLILGGAVGNWVDRVRVGAVIDFLDFRVWPVFNLADTAITTGVVLCMILFFKEQKNPSS